jgi:hypothetical protein
MPPMLPGKSDGFLTGIRFDGPVTTPSYAARTLLVHR